MYKSYCHPFISLLPWSVSPIAGPQVWSVLPGKCFLLVSHPHRLPVMSSLLSFYNAWPYVELCVDYRNSPSKHRCGLLLVFHTLSKLRWSQLRREDSAPLCSALSPQAQPLRLLLLGSVLTLPDWSRGTASYVGCSFPGSSTPEPLSFCCPWSFSNIEMRSWYHSTLNSSVMLYYI